MKKEIALNPNVSRKALFGGPPVQRSQRTSWRFVVMIGVVSLFGDTTYEGARSITGPFLASLGADAAAVAVVAGVGELVGYGLRLLSGHLVDRTKAYWPITILGYILNLLAVPALALAGSWQWAAALLILERLGKAIRTPARDAMLSHAASETSRGWAFGLHEAMDQVGALVGPVVVSVILYFHGGYRTGFGILIIPALAALSVLMLARASYPRPGELEVDVPRLSTRGMDRKFWVYLAACCAMGAGYTDFPLIAYHMKHTGAISENWIPGIYAVAMGADALAALALGKLFDRFGISVLSLVCLITGAFPPLVFSGSLEPVLIGMVLWGVGMGAQESVVRAAIAQLVPAHRRASAYGIFYSSFGVFWFLGSSAMGFLYEVSVEALVVLSVALQLAAAGLFAWARKGTGRTNKEKWQRGKEAD